MQFCVESNLEECLLYQDKVNFNMKNDIKDLFVVGSWLSQKIKDQPEEQINSIKIQLVNAIREGHIDEGRALVADSIDVEKLNVIMESYSQNIINIPYLFLSMFFQGSHVEADKDQNYMLNLQQTSIDSKPTIGLSEEGELFVKSSNTLVELSYIDHPDIKLSFNISFSYNLFIENSDKLFYRLSNLKLKFGGTDLFSAYTGKNIFDFVMNHTVMNSDLNINCNLIYRKLKLLSLIKDQVNLVNDIVTNCSDCVQAVFRCNNINLLSAKILFLEALNQYINDITVGQIVGSDVSLPWFKYRRRGLNRAKQLQMRCLNDHSNVNLADLIEACKHYKCFGRGKLETIVRNRVPEEELVEVSIN